MLSNSRRRIWFCLGLAVIFTVAMWSYVFQIWSAGQYFQFSDLYAPWWASHELMLNHRDPYTVAVAHEIQTFIYGAPSAAAFPGDPQEIAGGFAYPIHATFFLLPAVWLDFSTAQTWCAWIFGGLIALSVFLWLITLKWRPPPAVQALLVLCVLGGFPAAQAVKLRNLTALAAFFLAWALAALARNQLVLAGVLLAAATFKPQFVILLIPWLLIWAFTAWRGRRAFAISFTFSLLIFVAAGEWMVTGWVSKFLRIAAAYHEYTFSHSLFDMWLPRPLSWIAEGLVIAAVAQVALRSRRHPAQAPSFSMVCAWVLAVTLLVIPTLAPHAQLLLVPGYLIIFRYRHAIWGLAKLPRLFFVLACVLPLWESVTALLLNLALWRMSATDVHKFWLVVLYPSPLMPVGIALLLGYLLLRGIPLPAPHEQ